MFLDKQGAGYKFGGVATYRRCTNIPRQEMSCQGALGIEGEGGGRGQLLSQGSELSWAAKLKIGGMWVKGWV